MSTWTATVRRFGSPLALLVLVTGLAGVPMAAGGLAALHARAQWAAPPREARMYAVVRSPVAEAAREAFSQVAGLRVTAERDIDDLLMGGANAGRRQDRLRVIEVDVSLASPGGELAVSIEALRGVDGVVDVLDLDAAERAGRSPGRVTRRIGLGLTLVLFGLATFVVGVGWVAALAAQRSSDEIAARFVLGANPDRLWIPLAMAIAAAATLGVTMGLLATVVGLSIAPGAASLPWAPALAASWVRGWWAAIGGLALGLAAIGTATLTARRAVVKVVAGSLTAVALFASSAPRPAWGAISETVVDREELRSVARDLSATRRALHDASRDLAESELLLVRAAASRDPVLVRLAQARRAADARELERCRGVGETLIARRLEIRDLLHAAHAAESEIGPRQAPVSGWQALALRDARSATGARGLRGGVAIRARAGEVIRAAAAGRVAFAGELAAVGSVVVLGHGRRTYSVYGRVGEILVARGMEVAAGEPVAVAPQMPAAVFFAVRERGRAVDPLRWVQESARPAEEPAP